MNTIRLTSVLLATLAVAGSAQAADINAAPIYKAPPAIAASSWTGFYAGLGLGFRTTRSDVPTNSVALNGNPRDLAGRVLDLPFDGTAFRVNPFFGFNWQFAPFWVLGVEGDYGFANQTTTHNGFSASPGSDFDGDAADGLTTKTRWDASLRGRAGYLLSAQTMAYVTGGAAWQHYDMTSTCAGFRCINILRANPAIVTNSVTKMGWTVGGGIETALGGHWLARAEYRYADFGSVPFSIARTEVLGVQVDNLDAKLRTHTATFGLAYKFGDPVAPENTALGAFAMKPDLAAISWNGLYVGMGFGARASRTDLTTTSSFFARPVDLTRQPVGQPFDGIAFRVNPYVGFNWQFGPRWVAGIEGDFGFANQTTKLDGFEASPVSATIDPANNLSVKTRWDGSLRGRLGFLLTPATLAYLTGGAAWQNYEVTSTCLSTDPFATDCPFFAPKVVTNSITKAGWTAGGGFETILWGHWLARGEYRYADFGSAPFEIARTRTVGRPSSFVDNFDVTMRTHTVTFGLAYKFN